MASTPPYGQSGPDIESRVTPPAIAIIVVSGIAIAFSVLSLLLNLLGMGAGFLENVGQDERIGQLLGGTIGIVSNVLSLGVYGAAIYGALKMKALENYTLSVVAAVLVMLPCSCCCLIGLPIGIWSLVILMDANVKAAFRP